MATKKMKDHDLEKQYKREWYYRNRKTVIEANAARKQNIKQWFADYKKTLKCNRCGFSHPAALDFHHKEEISKEAGISIMVCQGCSPESILTEISKCEVLCSNCHRIHHYVE